MQISTLIFVFFFSLTPDVSPDVDGFYTSLHVTQATPEDNVELDTTKVGKVFFHSGFSNRPKVRLTEDASPKVPI